MGLWEPLSGIIVLENSRISITKNNYLRFTIRNLTMKPETDVEADEMSWDLALFLGWKLKGE